MNNKNNSEENPKRLLLVSVSRAIFMPTNQAAEILVYSDFFEANQEHFCLGGTICLAGVLNNFVTDARQIERTGVAAKVISISKDNDEDYRVKIRPFVRVEIPRMPTSSLSPFIEANYIYTTLKNEKFFKSQKEILVNIIEKLKKSPLKLTVNPPLSTLSSPKDIEYFSDQLINLLVSEPEIRQGLLNIYDLGERMYLLNKVLIKIIKSYEENKNSLKPAERPINNQKESTPPPIPKLKNVTSAFDNPPEELKVLAEKLINTDFFPEAKEVAEREFSNLRNMSSTSSEYSVLLKYLNWLTRIPWNKKTVENSSIINAAKILEKSHFGMHDVKERIVEFLAVKILNPEQKGKIICLVGPPGTGKTSIAKAVAEAMNRKFARFSVGGMRDEAEIKGHRRTYVGALPGKIIELLAKCDSKNPVIVIDEIDKMTRSNHGDPSAAMLELLDPEQNKNFIDHYIGEIPIDISDVFFITTANDLSTIEAALRDRMEIIEIHSYTELEKLEIAINFLIPKQLKENGISNFDVSFSKESLLFLVNGYTREAGVRNLEREIGNVCRKIAKKFVTSERYAKVITREVVFDLLGPPNHKENNNFSLEVGEVKGLAWTASGGQLQKIQVIKTKNTSCVEKTGTLGDVLKESITIALNLVVNRIEDPEGGENILKKCGLQIHAPAGATPKDGPSAGITIFTAIYSALTGKKVNPKVAMTGEIDVVGRVLPVGGLKEKIIAAYKEGLEKVIISSINKEDKGISALPSEVTDQVQIIYVDRIDEVLEHAIIEE